MIAATLAASAVVVATPTFAYAAPVDPAAALAKQYIAGHGVKVSETATLTMDGKKADLPSKLTGVVEFGKYGVIASDLTRRVKPDAATKKIIASNEEGMEGLAAMYRPTRYLTVKGITYVKGGLPYSSLPDGKKWLSLEDAEVSMPGSGQPIDIFDKKVMKTLLKSATSVKGGLYSGSISVKSLWQTSPKGNLDPKLGKVKIQYRIQLDGRQLVSRVTSKLVLDYGLLGKIASTVDTRFYDWGVKVSIVAPPADEVATAEDFAEEPTIEVPDLLNLDASRD